MFEIFQQIGITPDMLVATVSYIVTLAIMWTKLTVKVKELDARFLELSKMVSALMETNSKAITTLHDNIHELNTNIAVLTKEIDFTKKLLDLYKNDKEN